MQKHIENAIIRLNKEITTKGEVEMNPYIEQQINNMIDLQQSFKQTCKVAAMKNDGIIDKEEQKVINAINKAVDKYIKALSNIT